MTRQRPRRGNQLLAHSPARPTQYPAPAERERLIQRRLSILHELIPIFVTAQDGANADVSVQALARKYSLAEVGAIMQIFQRVMAERSDFIRDEAHAYRHYRRAFARFGGMRPFLPESQQSALQMENAKLNVARDVFSEAPLPSTPREQELTDLLLVDVDYFEDITPLAIPPRPADFVAPAPGVYGPPTQAILEWGWDLEAERYQRAAIKHGNEWIAAFSDLTRMALDPGLLHGWPGERASWAPYHAIHLLGILRAAASAAPLLALLDEPNDWLGDKLPLVWGQMGPPAEPPLWAYADDKRRTPDQRAVVLKGLAFMALEHRARFADIVQGFITRLNHSTPLDQKINAYCIHLLDARLHALEARAAIQAAFAQRKVDPRLMSLANVQMLEGNEG